MAKTVDLNTITRILAMQMAMVPDRSMKRALKAGGWKDLLAFQADYKEVYKTLDSETNPEQYHEFNRLLAAHKKAHFEEEAKQAGRNLARMDVDRDWVTVMRVREKYDAIVESMEGPEPDPTSLAALLRRTQELLQKPTRANIEKYLQTACVVWVDWREDAVDEIEYFAAFFAKGRLRVRTKKLKVSIEFGKRRENFELTETPADRHRAMIALNSALAPHYEIRLVQQPEASDGLAFAILSARNWKKLQSAYPKPTSRIFHKLTESVNPWEAGPLTASR